MVVHPGDTEVWVIPREVGTPPWMSDQPAGAINPILPA